MLSIVMSILSSITILLSGFYADDTRDPRTWRVLQENSEAPRGEVSPDGPR